MIKKIKAECQIVQDILINKKRDHLLPDEKSLISNHVKSCQSCAEFQENLRYLRDGMRVDEKLQMEPRNLTRQVLVSRFRKIHKKPDSKYIKLLTKIRLLFAYRIPLYQAMVATAVVSLFILFLSQSFLQKGSGDYPGVLSAVHDSVDVGIMDVRINLNFLDENKTGRNLKEDSSLTRYITTSL